MEPADRPGHAPLLTDEALARAVLAALRPAGLGERLRLRLGGGYTALQLWERLPFAHAADAAREDPTRVREELARVQACLAGLVAQGAVERRRAKMTVPLNTKGPRSVLVDVYRATEGRRAPG